MKVVCISDTHEATPSVPDGDLLIHAGDFSYHGDAKAVARFNAWLGDLKPRFKQIILISGNHELGLENNYLMAKVMLSNALYLEHEPAEVLGYKVFGSPWTPRFFDWAWNADRGDELAKKWAMIPDDTEILVTHGPPMGVLDSIPGHTNLGCYDLRERIKTLKSLKLHVFGHIHHGHGLHQEGGVTFVNAAIMTEQYNPYQPPIIVDLPDKFLDKNIPAKHITGVDDVRA